MKQAGYKWYMFLSKQLEKLGLVQSDMMETIFKNYRPEQPEKVYTKDTSLGRLVVALYVDDLFLVA